ncbi:MAG: Vitamin B12 dependent methionine synthase activation subunit [Eubacterium sp.]|nr:Vitamin B12 dependent methionine synthase activation subunit [Eubacterium sp.]
MDRKEILRYLRTNTHTEDAAILALADEAAATVEKTAVPKTIYRIFDCTVTQDGVTIEGHLFPSCRLAQTVQGCRRIVVFAATLGIQTDRLIQSALMTDTAKAMAYQAAAAAKIEEVCDQLEDELRRTHGVQLRQRYSPGYFDLPITEQRALFRLMDITKRIGLTLTDTCEMVPTKSVTAFIGIEETV